MFTLQFDQGKVRALAARYAYETDSFIVDGIAPAARSRGYYTRDEFVRVCRWKTPRSQPLVESNDAALVEEATRVALSVVGETLRVGILMMLSGVSLPTASVLLHFAHRDPYPIIDYRALEAWGVTVRPPYAFPLWMSYVDACRQLASDTGLDMRTIDRALWQWSKERSDS